VNMENVLRREEASNARLKCKKYLNVVEFKWTSPTHSQESENIIFDMREPHPNLKRLKINNFGGEKFPNWLGSPSLVSIPMDCVSGTLKSLEVSDCKKLQLEESHCYPVLEILILRSCDSLISFQLVLFPKLKELCIEDCNNLQTILSTANNLPFLQNLTLKNCSKLALFSEGELSKMTSLNSLHLKSLPTLTSLEGIGIEHLTSLKKLRIEDCGNLASLPIVDSLSHLTVRGCPLLKSHFEGGAGKYSKMVSSIPSTIIEA